MGKRILSYSLWGSSRLYNEGAIENIKFAQRYYPGWTPRFYVAANCPVIHELIRMKNDGLCEVYRMPPSDYVVGSTTNVAEHANPLHANMLWRNEALFDKEVDIVLLRDCDSRTSPREADAVNEWLESHNEYPIHAIYDHPAHYNGIMPGMMGFQRLIVDQIYRNYIDYKNNLDYFKNWYNTEGYKQGLRNVHIDIHAMVALFINKIGWDRIYKVGYGTDNPLKTPMPEDGSCGAHVGSTVCEAWRNEVCYGRKK